MAPWIVLLFVGSTAAIAGGIGGGDRRFTPLLGNTSVLPSGWIQDPVVPCLGCVHSDSFHQTRNITEKINCSTCPDILFGPTFTDATSMTIESCVAFCNQQGQRLAGLLGPQCGVFRDFKYFIEEQLLIVLLLQSVATYSDLVETVLRVTQASALSPDSLPHVPETP